MVRLDCQRHFRLREDLVSLVNGTSELKTRLIWTCLLCLTLIFFGRLVFDFSTTEKSSESAVTPTFGYDSLATSKEPVKKELATQNSLPNLNERQLQGLMREPTTMRENELMKAQIPAGAKTMESLILDAQNAKVKSEIDSAKSPFQSN